MSVVVIDTNVLASGFVGSTQPGSLPGQLLRAWRSGLFELGTSEHILGELRHTFENPYFRRRLTPQQMARILVLLTRRAVIIPMLVEVHGVATHPEDDLILAAAVSAHADFLVTGDRKLQRLGSYEGVTILSPRAFFERLTGERSG